MKKLIFAILLSLAVAGVAVGQSYTTVTATVTDNSAAATVYALGSYNVTLSNNSGQQALFGGNASFQQIFSGQSLSSAGVLSIVLPSVTQMTPGGMQWTFRICANPAQIAAVFPPVALPCFTYTSTGTQISGASVDISTSLKAAAATIPTVGSGSGFPVTSSQTVSSGGSITPTGTGAVNVAAANSPIPQNDVGPGFNVLNYGAVNDGQTSATCTLNTSTTHVCPQATFTAADVGKEMICGFVNTASPGTYLPRTTILSITNPTTVVTGAASISSFSGASCSWGTAASVNDAAIATAVTAWVAAIHGINTLGIIGKPPSSPILSFPGGGYLVCNLSITVPTNKDGFLITGDVLDGSHLIWEPGCNMNQGAAGIDIAGNATNGYVQNLTLNGMGGVQAPSGAAAFRTSGNIYVNNINIQGFGISQGLLASGGSIYARGITVKNNTQKGFICNQCGGDIDAGILSNNGQNNLTVQNVSGMPTGAGFRIGRALLVDETGNAAFPPTLVTNSHDVIFDMPQLFSTPGGFALDCDANSHVTFIGGSVAVFNNDTNSGGVRVRNGCVLDAANVRFSSTGTAKAIQVDAGGNFRDNGGNSSESMFTIVSGTSTGTAVVLTLTTLGANVNTNCSVGDAFVVQGAGIAGYNTYGLAGTTTGITAVTATTVSYTSIGSNMGALSAGGVFSCRNLQSYSGTLPIALLNVPTTNTCYVTGTFGATVTGAPMCNARIPSATNIQRITAASTTVTACTVAPVVTISDGTASITLTITTAKSQWDSSVDASSGVGTTIFKPNGTLQVTNTAGTCTTPPTNFSVSYNPTPILSN